MGTNELTDRVFRFLRGGEKLGEEAGNECGREDDKEFVKVLHQLDTLAKSSCRPEKQQMWDHIHRHIVVSRRRRRFRQWSAVAAVLLPAILGVVLLFNQSETERSDSSSVVMAEIHRVQLLLNDGRVIQVQGIDKDSLLNEAGAGIQLDTSCSIVYTGGQIGREELVFNTLRVPRCCEYHLVLADGTQVWMNSESELRYPVDFVGQERRVFLTGEAYFQVAKDASKPFRVEAEGMTVEALGTGFDVNAYRDGGKLLTTLVEGRVRVSYGSAGNECVLTPGKQVVFSDGKLAVIDDVKVDDIIGWKEGRFVFSNMTLEEIGYQLERWYDVEIGFQEPLLRNYRFTGIMKRYNKLSQLTELIEETTDVKFRKDGRNIYICRR